MIPKAFGTSAFTIVKLQNTLDYFEITIGINSTSYATSTGMGSWLCVGHDKITRALSTGKYDSKFLWKQAQTLYGRIARAKEMSVLVFDDSIEAKPYTDESDLNCWHFDHTVKGNVKGVNFLTTLVEVGCMRIPCGVEFIR